MIPILFFFAALYIWFFAGWRRCRQNNNLCHIPKGLKIINLGSTYAYYGLDYSTSLLPGRNLAGIPQYLHHDMVLLRKFKKRLPPGAFVLFILPNFVFCKSQELRDFQTLRYYSALYPWEIPGFRIKLYLKYRCLAAWELITNKQKKQAEKWKGYQAPHEEKVRHALRRIRDWEEGLSIPSVKSGAITDGLRQRIECNRRILCNMIDLCKTDNLIPVLITMPVSPIMQDMVSRDCLEVYLKEPIRRTIEDTDVLFLDFSQDKAFEDETLYLNSDCLNEAGRRLFTDKVLRLLNEQRSDNYEGGAN